MVMHRYECMQQMAEVLSNELVVLSLGGAVDEWYSVAPRMRNASLFQQQLGCVTAEAFGLALGLSHRKIVALDTDGGMLFNLGILATLANESPSNLVIVVWDNGCYLSIGGPPTHTSGVVDLMRIARGAGIANSHNAASLTEFRKLFGQAIAEDQLAFIVAKVDKETLPNMLRKSSDGTEDVLRFVRTVEETERTTIIHPSEHN